MQTAHHFFYKLILWERDGFTVRGQHKEGTVFATCGGGTIHLLLLQSTVYTQGHYSRTMPPLTPKERAHASAI